MMNRTLIAMLLSLHISACKGGGGSSSASTSSEETTGSCETSTATHSGCCSSHGGIGGQCNPGELCLTPSGRIVCSDGTISPTCTQTKSGIEDLLLNEDDEENDKVSSLYVTCT